MEQLNLNENYLSNLDSITPSKFRKLLLLGIANNKFTKKYLDNFIHQWETLQFTGNVWEQKISREWMYDFRFYDTEMSAEMSTEMSTEMFTEMSTEISIDADQEYFSSESPKLDTQISERSNWNDGLPKEKTEFHSKTTHLSTAGELNKQSDQFQCENLIKLNPQNLRHFSIAGNNLNNTVEIIQLLGTPLESLDVSSNFIGILRRSTFEHFANLQYLNLSRTNLKFISKTDFNNLKKLKVLDLSYNDLENLKFGLPFNELLEILNLEGNRFVEIDAVTPFQFPKLSTLGIANNLFSCQYLSKFLNQWKNLELSGPKSFNSMNFRGIECSF